MGWTLWIGALLVALGILLPVLGAYCAEWENRAQPLRWRGGGLSVEFIVGDAAAMRAGAGSAIVPRIELFADDMNNVVMFPNHIDERAVEEQYTLLLRNLISYFERRLKS